MWNVRLDKLYFHFSFDKQHEEDSHIPEIFLVVKEKVQLQALANLTVLSGGFSFSVLMLPCSWPSPLQ